MIDEKIISTAIAYVTGNMWGWLPEHFTGEEVGYRKPTLKEVQEMQGENIRENVINYLSQNKI